MFITLGTHCDLFWMGTHIECLERGTEIQRRALELMEQKAITVLPVVDERRRVLGIIHLHDLLGRGEFRFTT